MHINITKNLTQLINEINDYANNLGISSPQLVAVSKNFMPAQIIEAHTCGQTHFGENYAQELQEKALILKGLSPPIIWHFIGQIQSNKTKLIATYADFVHGLDSLTHAVRLNEQRPSFLKPLKIFIEVNISREINKGGLSQFEQILQLALEVQSLPNLQLIGLMAIATHTDSQQKIKSQFTFIHNLMEHLNHHKLNLKDLSLGMSNDYKLAMEYGATYLRIGRAIFGERNYDK